MGTKGVCGMGQFIFRKFGTALLILGLMALPECGWLGNAQITSSGASQIQSTGNTGSNPIGTIGTTSTAAALSLNMTSPMTESQCWGAAVTYNSGGAASPVPLTTTIALYAASTVTFFSDPGCSNSIASVTLAAGSTTAPFWVAISQTGTLSITAQVTAGSSATPAVGSMTVNATAPATVPTSLLVSGATQILAGTCVGYSAVLVNAQNIPLGFTTASQLLLSGGGSGTLYYASTDSTCSQGSVTSLTIPANQAVTTFFMRRTVTGSGSILANEGNLNGSLPVLTTAGNPNQLVVQGPSTIDNNSCGVYSVLVEDIVGNSTMFSSSQVITLADNGVGTLYSDSACTQAATSLSLPANTTGANFYFLSTTGGTATLTASNSSVTPGSLAVNVINVGPGKPAKLSFTAPGTVTTVGTCYGPYTINELDVNNVLIPNPPADVISLTSTGNGVFYSDGGCQYFTNSTTPGTSFFYLDKRAEGPFNLNANDTTTALGSATQPLTVNAGTAAGVTLLAQQTTFSAGSCVPFVAAFVDAYGNTTPVLSTTKVTIAESSLTLAGYYADSSCQNSLNTTTSSTVSTGNGAPTVTTTSTQLQFTAGTYQQTFYMVATQSGQGVMTASSTGLNSANLNITVNPGAPTQITLIHSPTTVTINACSGGFTFELLDQYNNPTTATATTTFTITISSGTGVFFPVNGCSGTPTNTVTFGSGTGTQTVYFEGTSPGPIVSIIQTGGYPPVTFTFNENSAGPVSIALNGLSPLPAVSPGQGVDGQCLPFQLSLVDALNNPSAASTAIPATISVVGMGTELLFSDSACSNPLTSGAITIAAQTSSINFYYMGKGTGSQVLTAMSPNLNTGTYTVVLTAGPAASFALSGPTTGTAGVCSGPFQITANDAYGNPTSAPGATFKLTGSGKGFFYSDSTCTTTITSVSMTAPYVSSQFYLNDDTAECLTLQASTGTTASNVWAFTETPNSPSIIAFNGPSQGASSACIGPITFLVEDQYGNVIVDPVNDRTFSLSESPATIPLQNKGCTAPINMATIAHGTTSSTGIYFSASTTTNAVVTVAQTSPPLLSLQGILDIAVVVAPPPPPPPPPVCTTQVTSASIPGTAHPIMDYGVGYLKCVINGQVVDGSQNQSTCNYDNWGYRTGNQCQYNMQGSTAPILLRTGLVPGETLKVGSLSGTVVASVSPFSSKTCTQPGGANLPTPRGLPLLQFADASGKVVPLPSVDNSLNDQGVNAFSALSLMSASIVVPPKAVALYGSWPDNVYSDNSGCCSLTIISTICTTP